MSAYLFAVRDPDLELPRSATTYVRVKLSSPPETSLMQLFIILSSTSFNHFPHMLSRGLDLVIFNGILKDSEEIMSISISDLEELWQLIIDDFSKVFHVTFQMNCSQKVLPRTSEPECVALYSMFQSPSDREAMRLSREGDENGQYLPLSRKEWCLLGSQRSASHQPYVERQWDDTIDLFFRANEVRYTKTVVNDKNHALYIFLERFCLLLSRLNFRWHKIVAADSSFLSCSVLSPFFNSTSKRGYSNHDDENLIDNQGAIHLRCFL